MRVVVLVLSLCFSVPGMAEVTAAGPGGFNLKLVGHSKSSPEQAYEAFGAIEKWWDASHSYSGEAANLSLNLEPGGMFFETLPGGGFVEHLSVVHTNPGKEVRLLGGLGPLQAMGLHGALTMQFKPHEKGCEIVMLYNVSGYSAQGLEGLAAIVDRVQAGQLERLVAYADTL